MFNLFKDDFTLAHSSENPSIAGEALSSCSLIRDLVSEKFPSSFKLYIFDSGSCNGCELELQMLFSPLYNLSAYGLEVVYDIAKADVLLITGLMTQNMHVELEAIYLKLKAPKEIIMIGDCPLQSMVFKDTFALKTKASNFFPNAFHIPGCPPEPLELLEGLVEYLKKL